ncbi:hydroxymethylglutaryl-CoA lyase [Paucibacter sp. JuS9]|uniref:hydroxymethylglutaryl-CoA lyase n=1 Tax=Paucibacter sp. JuS9 TaxID=3228748 RepID=UPI0037562F99
MNARPRVLVNEVGPRDGLQNQRVQVEMEDKLRLIGALVAAGVSSIEATSFVSPKAVPQMADADGLLLRLPAKEQVRYSVLVPNERGLQRAIAAGAREVAVVLSATETMNRRNINMGLAEARAACEATLAAARAAGLRSKAYVAVAFECPYEGVVTPETVRTLTEAMFRADADEVVIADTIGAASPADVAALLNPLVAQHGAERLSIHLHDTRGMAVANAWAALDAGMRQFDSSVGGLGGCPFAPGAAGNLATEDLVLLAAQCGFETGISLPPLMDAIDLAAQITGRPLGGRSHAWLMRQYRSHAA